MASSTVYIPVLDLKPGIESQEQEIINAIKSVIDSTDFINGPAVANFESNIAHYLGVKHAIGLNSGTDAITIGLRALNIRPGDEIITTPFTFYATTEAIQHLGAKPVFVDIDPVTYNMKTELIEEKINSRTRAIVVVHLFGHGAAMDEIMELAKKHDLKVLEDTAQAFSGSHRGRKLGTIGHLGAYSFFPSKNLGAFGDAGLLATNDDELAEKTRMLRAHGSKQKYYNEMVGYNSRLDSLQAAILNVKLQKIHEVTTARREAAVRYCDLLADIPGIDLPRELEGFTHCYHQFTIRVKNGKRTALKESLHKNGVGTMVYYPIPIHQLPVFSDLRQTYTEAERAAAEVLSLPLWPEITPTIQARVAEQIRETLLKI